MAMFKRSGNNPGPEDSPGPGGGPGRIANAVNWFGEALNQAANGIIWGGLAFIALRAVLVVMRTLIADKADSLTFSVSGGNWPFLIVLPMVFCSLYVWRASRGITMLGIKFTYALLIWVLLQVWAFFATAHPAAYGFLDAAVAVYLPLLLVWPLLMGRERKPANPLSGRVIQGESDETIVQPGGAAPYGDGVGSSDGYVGPWPPEDPSGHAGPR